MPNFNKTDLLYAALKGCIDVMERDLNGLAVIQPELKQAKQAIDQFELVDAEFEEWNGKGLPPVRYVVLTQDKGVWFRVKILSYAKIANTDAVMCRTEEPGSDFGELHAWIASLCEFKPIPTPEQIAAEEEEKAIAAMAEDLRAGFANPKTAARNLYKAGYRKQVAE